MCDAYDTYLQKLKYSYIGRHMAVTLFKSPPFFTKPKNVEIPKRLGVSAVVVESSNNFFPDTAGFSKSRYMLNVSEKCK